LRTYHIHILAGRKTLISGGQSGTGWNTPNQLPPSGAFTMVVKDVVSWPETAAIIYSFSCDLTPASAVYPICQKEKG
jgi:hypothetical protein